MPRNNSSANKIVKPNSMNGNKHQHRNILPVKHAQSIQETQQQPFSLSNSIKESFGWGFGSGLGHKLVDSTFNYFLQKNLSSHSHPPSP